MENNIKLDKCSQKILNQSQSIILDFMTFVIIRKSLIFYVNNLKRKYKKHKSFLNMTRK